MQGNTGENHTARNSNGGNNSNKGGASPQKKLPEAYLNQINILKALNNKPSSEARPIQIDEIATASGLKDERETQRFLYILEGLKLVAPHPAGDFTSRHWVITPEGIKALRSLPSAKAA
jgi:hypothetical protein